MRIGIGRDLHRLVVGRRLVLGGIEIAHEAGLVGHSDADVLTHAIADAILGALASGDLGTHFPDSDPVWKNANSLKLLSRVATIATARGMMVGNVDATIVAAAPPIAPHRQAMRERLAAALNVSVKSISVKATTGEGVGPEGRGEAISATAIVLLTGDTRRPHTFMEMLE